MTLVGSSLDKTGTTTANENFFLGFVILFLPYICIGCVLITETIAVRAGTCAGSCACSTKDGVAVGSTVGVVITTGVGVVVSGSSVSGTTFCTIETENISEESKPRG